MSLRPDQYAALDELRQAWHLREQNEACQPFVWRQEQGRTLHLDDVSGIPFLDGVPGMEEYQHRARVRCADGDLFAAVTPPAEGYEAYCRDILGMGAPTFVIAEPAGSVVEVAAACLQGRAFEQICDVARHNGELTIHPYMGIASVWALAAKIAEATGAALRVIAPPPAVTWIANDKGRLMRLIDAVLGADKRIAGEQSCDLNEVARNLRKMAAQHRRVGLKRSRCASAMGNRVYESAQIMALDDQQLILLVKEFAADTRWDGDEELLACAWVDAIASPSTQLWIPPKGRGEPRLDGVYEQLLEGDECVFLGSVPSRLPDLVNRALQRRSVELASALQELGYVGRCSFDFVLLGDPDGAFEVLFTECNGRWGGTSTPMALVDRLVPGPRPVYRAQDVLFDELVARPLDSICKALADDLYRPGKGGRFILYNVGPLAGSGKLDVVALASSPQDADRALLSDLPRALGIGNG